MTCLEELHQQHLTKLDGPGQLDYLLSCQQFLKENDVNGWKKNYAPGLLTEKNLPGEKACHHTIKKKRRRMCPDARIWTEYPACSKCQSRDIIEDTREGSVVCTACGLIQVMQLMKLGSANMPYEQLKNGNRKVVHRYSRVVYFRSFVTALQGKTTPVISSEELKSLQVITAGVSWIDADIVTKALKRMKKTTKFRRHKHRLAVMLNPEYTPVQIPAETFFELMRVFRVVEWNWQFGGKKKLHERRVFFSYPFVFYQLCFHLGCMEYTGTHHLLKDRDLLNRLYYAYGCLAKKADLKYQLNVYREKSDDK